MRLFFSVVITVYNKADFIESTIKSVLNQTYKNFEIIVINDGSTDRSEAIIKTHNDTRIKLITTENKGASHARNLGIQNANYDYIALLDGDDLWDKSYLKVFCEAIKTFPEQHIFACAASHKYGNKLIPVKYSFEQSECFKLHNYFEASKKHTIITSSSVVFHASILEQTGLFDPTIVSGQDTDMWIRFGLFASIVFINKKLAIYNHNPYSLSNTTFELKHKSKFNKYINFEKENAPLKAFLDRNRYSMAILSKIVEDPKSFQYYNTHINYNNLDSKQRFLIKSPRWLLRILIKLKSLKKQKLYYPNR